MHGHLHKPELLENHRPNILGILSSGSIGGKPWPNKTTGILPNNQFHLIEIDDGDHFCGVIHSWNWTQTKGWTRSTRDIANGLPNTTGFGARTSWSGLLQLICQAYSVGEEMMWKDVKVEFSDIRLLSAREQELLINELLTNGFEFTYERSGEPNQILRSR